MPSGRLDPFLGRLGNQRVDDEPRGPQAHDWAGRLGRRAAKSRRRQARAEVPADSAAFPGRA
eukprot:4617254-Alexandrium_andersonii.AAC.1